MRVPSREVRIHFLATVQVSLCASAWDIWHLCLSQIMTFIVRLAGKGGGGRKRRRRKSRKTVIRRRRKRRDSFSLLEDIKVNLVVAENWVRNEDAISLLLLCLSLSLMKRHGEDEEESVGRESP